jgi:MFS family permease
LGIFLGGWAADALVRRRASGRMEVATLALLLGAPCSFLALNQPAGELWAFALWMLPACMMFYVYYPAVYATVQDVIEPSLRGTAMAVYFFAMYLLGGAVGPVLLGQLSDYLAGRALAEGLAESREAARALGLHQAMYLIPALGLGLVVVLFAGSRTVTRDHRRLEERLALAAKKATA